MDAAAFAPARVFATSNIFFDQRDTGGTMAILQFPGDSQADDAPADQHKITAGHVRLR